MQSYTFVLALVLVAAVQGFAPVSQGRAGSQLSESLFDKIANMDLFAPKKDQNTYGARDKKNVSLWGIQRIVFYLQLLKDTMNGENVWTFVFVYGELIKVHEKLKCRDCLSIVFWHSIFSNKLVFQLQIGTITSNSYVPQGLNAKQYAEIRKKEQAKKQANYKRNVAKAGVFEDYTDFYTKRGTDLSQDWAKNKNTLGHRFAKTKFDWSGKKMAATTTAEVAVKKGKKRFGKK